MNTLITVSRRHITKGIANSPEECPIALAIKPKLKRAYVPNVIGHTVELESNGEFVFALPLSKTAQKFVQSFDNNERVKPFSFNLRLPKSVLRVQPIKG